MPDCPDGQRLDQALATVLPQYSRSRLSAWIRDGEVRLNGKAARPRDAVFGGEKVTVLARPVADDGVLPERMPIQVLYRDSHVFVIDKPAGLVVHPGAGNRSRTLQNGLLSLNNVRLKDNLYQLIAGVVNRQTKCVLLDPYANAFYLDPDQPTHWASDHTDMKPGLHERKWEIDSLCYTVRLAHGYWKTSGDTSVFGAQGRFNF